MWYYVVLCGVIDYVCNDRQNCCSLGGHRKQGGWGGVAEAFCLLLGAPSLLQQPGPQCRRGRKEPNWRQSSFLAVGPPLEASILLRRRISEGAL